jgi:hypothetical protein
MYFNIILPAFSHYIVVVFLTIKLYSFIDMVHRFATNY